MSNYQYFRFVRNVVLLLLLYYNINNVTRVIGELFERCTAGFFASFSPSNALVGACKKLIISTTISARRLLIPLRVINNRTTFNHYGIAIIIVIFLLSSSLCYLCVFPCRQGLLAVSRTSIAAALKKMIRVSR